MASLNPKQAVFVAAYIGQAKRNATEAARIAGFKQPGSYGHDLLKKPEIQAAIDEHLAAVKREGIATLQNRVDALNDRWQRMAQVIDERAADEWTADVPGGGTGLIVKQLKHVTHDYAKDPADPNSKAVRVVQEQWEAAVDTGILKSLLDHEKQAAQELGQWVERGELGGTGGGPLIIRSVSVPLPARDDGDDE